jgi:hypothetical protein
MVFVLTYGGWNDAAYISAEVWDPRRNMVRALLYSIGCHVALRARQRRLHEGAWLRRHGAPTPSLRTS